MILLLELLEWWKARREASFRPRNAAAFAQAVEAQRARMLRARQGQPPGDAPTIPRGYTWDEVLHAALD